MWLYVRVAQQAEHLLLCLPWVLFGKRSFGFSTDGGGDYCPCFFLLKGQRVEMPNWCANEISHREHPHSLSTAAKASVDKELWRAKENHGGLIEFENM